MAFPFQGDGVGESPNYIWPEYEAMDRFSAAWIWSGTRQTVLIGCNKGTGDTYYGLQNDPVCSMATGYHSEPYEPRLYFIDVNDLGAVAQGVISPSDVLPYQTVQVSAMEAWHHPSDPGERPECRWPWFAGFAFDEANGRLSAAQPRAP